MNKFSDDSFMSMRSNCFPLFADAWRVRQRGLLHHHLRRVLLQPPVQRKHHPAPAQASLVCPQQNLEQQVMILLFLSNFSLILFNPCVKSFHLYQAARLSIFKKRKIYRVAPPWGTWIKDTPLIGKRWKSAVPGGIWTHDLKSYAPQACALPLCSNHFQSWTPVLKNTIFWTNVHNLWPKMMPWKLFTTDHFWPQIMNICSSK